MNGEEAAEENVAEENTIEKSGEEQSTPAEDEYVLAGDEQFRITDTADISMKERCNNYAYPFDIVIPVVVQHTTLSKGTPKKKLESLREQMLWLIVRA